MSLFFLFNFSKLIQFLKTNVTTNQKSKCLDIGTFLYQVKIKIIYNKHKKINLHRKRKEYLKKKKN